MKKFYPYLKLSMMMVLTVVIFSCEKKQEESFSVSETSFSLEPAGESVKTIIVTSEKDWTVEYESEGNWLIEKSKDDDSFVVGAEKNIEKKDREGTILVKSGDETITIRVMQSFVTITLKRIDDFAKAECSPSNVFLAACVSDGAEEVYAILRMNAVTGEIKKFTSTRNSMIVGAIGDDGTIFAADSNSLIGVIITTEDKIMDLPLPDGVSSGFVAGVSTDGKTWVGYGTNNSGVGPSSRPIKWVNSVPEYLPETENNIMGGPLRIGLLPRGCSDDASVIYGSEWDTAAAVYWRDGEVNYVARESVEIVDKAYSGPILTNERTNISPNGKYIAYTYGKVVKISDDVLKQEKYAGRFDTETNEYIQFAEENHRPTTVSNQGDLFISKLDKEGRLPVKGYVAPAGSPQEVKFTPISTWVKDKYDYDMSGNEMVWHISETGNLFGAYETDNHYVKILKNWYLYVH